MAGTWLKIRHDILRSPEVRRIGRAMSMDRYAVVGRLFAVWTWFDQHSTSGRINGAVLEDVDDEAETPGFAAAMAAAGWLEADADGLTYPNWERHNGESAKERALKAERQRRFRERGATSATQALRPVAPRAHHGATAGAQTRARPAAPGAESTESEPVGIAAQATKTALEAGAGRRKRPPTDAEIVENHGENHGRGDRGATSATRAPHPVALDAPPEKRREEERREENRVPPPPPPPREASPGAADAYARLLAAWEPAAAAGHAKPWRSPRPPRELADRLADPDWLALALEAIGRLAGCRYFRTPARLDQLCEDGFAERVLAGKYDDLATPRAARGDAEPPRTPPERRRYFRGEFQKSMTDAEYRAALAERKATV